MEFAGEWYLCRDATVRPIIRLRMRAVDGTFQAEYFLIDTGADRTVLSAAFWQRLQLPALGPPASSLSGIGGPGSSILVTSVLQLTSIDGHEITVPGDFAAFTNPADSEYSLLGRDLLRSFDLIVSREEGPIRLLAEVHSYQVVSP